jgi:hypothetical protein
MNKRALLICFIVIAILSLLVSTFAVFVTARAFLLNRPQDSVSADDKGSGTPEAPQDTCGESSDVGSDESEVMEDVGDDVLVGAGTAKEPQYTIKYEGGYLKVFSDDGTVLYSRKAPLGKPCENELEALLAGIAFSDYSAAISAIYDLVS